MRRKKSTAPPKVLNPRRGCEDCGGTGWAKGSVTPPPIQGPGGREVTYVPVPVRCSCTKPKVAPQPAPPALDQAQRAAGEKED